MHIQVKKELSFIYSDPNDTSIGIEMHLVQVINAGTLMLIVSVHSGVNAPIYRLHKLVITYRASESD